MGTLALAAEGSPLPAVSDPTLGAVRADQEAAARAAALLVAPARSAEPTLRMAFAMLTLREKCATLQVLVVLRAEPIRRMVFAKPILREKSSPRAALDLREPLLRKAIVKRTLQEK